MALAVKNATQTTPRPALNRLAVGSLLGALYVLASLAIVFYGVPKLWSLAVSPALASVAAIDATLLILVMGAVGAALFYYGMRLLGPHPQHGLKAGIFAGIVLVFTAGLVTEWVGEICEKLIYSNQMFGSSGPTIGMGVSGLVGVCLLVAGGRLFFRPAFEKRLLTFEDQGWFSLTSYKRTQGQRVRRGTIFCILVLAGCGIYTLLAHHTLETGPEDWGLSIPFTASVTVTDPGDSDVIDSPIRTADMVRIIDPGKVENTKWKRGDLVARMEYKAEVERRTKARESLPVAGPVVDRYTLREVNNQLVAGYVRVTDPGSTKLEKGKVVSRLDFENEAAKAAEKPPKSEMPHLAGGITEYQKLSLLPHVRFTLPILLTAFSIWFSYRLVSFPPFADFLIATEAELNKVSWVTRKRLIQDTIVVLVTMLLLTVFLFVVDVFWSTILSSRFIAVLPQASSSTVDTSDLDDQIRNLEKEAADEQDPKKAKDLHNELELRKKERDRKKQEKPDDPYDW